MTPLAAHISALLHDNDCVIIPGFGGLVSHYQPARIHPTQHIFSPPAKAIAFNRNLSQNDGLLANHISGLTGCDYKEALSLIGRQVQEIQFALEQGKNIRMEGVGMFMLDVEKNLQFYPSEETNYLADAFGLAEFQSQAILRDGIREKQPISIGAPAKRPEEKTGRKKVVRRVVALGTIAIVSGICALPFLFPDSKIGMHQISGFFSSDASQAGKFKPRIADFKITEDPNPLSSGRQGEVASIDFLKDGSPALILDNRPIGVVHADTTKAVTIAPIKIRETRIQNFEIIAGCFSLEGNAQKYVEQLRAEFPEVSIIGKNLSGLYRVSIGSASNRQEAETMLAGSREKLPQVWLLSNN
jgi:nucleoid DNA-binding protein